MKKSAGLVVVAAISILSACRKSDAPATAPASNPNTISAPLSINLIPAQNQAEGDRRIYLPLLHVGSVKSSLTTVFDSGSEGLVLSGMSLFGLTYISDTGIVINSPDSAIIDGITVTSTKVSYTYGDPPATESFYGNIAYASITIGDATASIQTRRMPFVVIYKGVNNQTQGSVPVDANSDGIAGVQSSGFDPAATLITNRNQVKSPFNYITYAGGLYAGFMLAPLSQIGWSNQASNTGFAPTPLLTLGLTDAMKTGFSLQSQRMDLGNLYDPDIVGNVAYGRTSLQNNVILLDTGTPVGYTIYNSQTGGSNTLANGTQVQLSTPEGFSYGYTAETPLFQTIVQSNGQTRSIFGIDFFLNNYFLLDYTEHYIGLKGS